MRTKSTFDHAAHVLRARLVWDELNDNEKFGCKFGMFPAKPMDVVEKEGYDNRLIVHELMHKACAK